uniref:hypothetical protein n=1 Tax=Streptomyces sp. NRRL S-325 TaxID=1463899 RepID=UPI00131CCE89|nr:hypothetical protein [Streptomyces sp. NRRL S-325]
MAAGAAFLWVGGVGVSTLFEGVYLAVFWLGMFWVVSMFLFCLWVLVRLLFWVLAVLCWGR